MEEKPTAPKASAMNGPFNGKQQLLGEHFTGAVRHIRAITATYHEPAM